jgi:hypothetical protein
LSKFWLAKAESPDSILAVERGCVFGCRLWHRGLVSLLVEGIFNFHNCLSQHVANEELQAVTAYSPTLLAQAGYSDIKQNGLAGGINTIGIIGTIISAQIIDRLGRRVCLMGGAAVLFAVNLIVSVIQSQLSVEPLLILIFFVRPELFTRALCITPRRHLSMHLVQSSCFSCLIWGK